MVAILERGEFNTDFHPMVDFIAASPFRIETTDEGTHILATVDGIQRTMSEASLRRNLKLRDEDGITTWICLSKEVIQLRRNLKLQDEEGISSLPNTELFENLTLIGYNISPNQKFTFQKGQFSHQWKYLIHTIIPSFSGRIVLFDTMLVPKGEGSGTPTELHHTPSSKALPTSHTTYSSPTLPPVPTAPIPTVTPSETTPIRQYTRRARIAQSSALPLITDEPASPLRDVSQGEACPTDFGFIADQDRANIAQSYTLPHDPALRVTPPAAVEGSMQHIIDELTTLCTSLQRKNSEMIAKLEAQVVEINMLKARVKLLKDREGVAAERFRDDAPIKGRNLDKGEAAAERVSDDSEEMANVLTSIDAATILSGGVAEVPTGSGSIPTTSPPATRVATGSDVVPTASTIFATATYQVSARVSTICFRITSGKKELISDLIKYQDNYAKIYKYQSQQRNPLIKKQQREFYTAVLRNQTGWKAKHFKGMTLEEIKENFDPVWKQLHDFVPIGSKEEAKRFKRKGTRFEQESTKKLKTSEEVPEEVKSPDEVYTEGKRSYWKITRLGGSSASYHLFVDMLKHLDKEDLNQLWRIVEESLSNMPPTSDKEMELLVELNRLYEPDEDDQLWTHTQNLMHAPVEWKLYDSCGVHHVKNYSRMANDLILKIFKISSTPRQQVIEFPLAEEVPTASLIFATATESTQYTRRKGKETMSQQRKPLTKKQHREFCTAVLRNQAGWKAKHFKGMTLEEIKENFDLVWKQLHDFVPIGSKEEAERFKRKGTRFEQESIKKLKTSEEVLEEVKSPDEVPKENVKEMMQLVPIEEVYVEALQHLDREDLNKLWRIFKESLSNRPPTSDKEMELWVELNRLYEPDEDDQLWTHTQNLMHAPIGGSFPLLEEVPTASEESSHCQKKRDATAKRIALLGKCPMITLRL
nr:hypothetical protein [Tanacetum cinerariifolium]